MILSIVDSRFQQLESKVQQLTAGFSCWFPCGFEVYAVLGGFSLWVLGLCGFGGLALMGWVVIFRRSCNERVLHLANPKHL